MSKIDDLINKLCPNGVEFKDLEKCCNILDNKRKPVTKSARISGKYPYYGANGIQDYVSEYIFDGKFVLVGEDGSVINDNGNPIVTWAEGKIWVNNHAHIIEEIDGISLRYLYYYIQTINVSTLIHGNIPKLNQGDFRKLKIAVPPVEIQYEIVKILDNFWNLLELLKNELDIQKSILEEITNRIFEKMIYEKENIITLGEITKAETQKNKGQVIQLAYSITKNGLIPTKDYFGETKITSDDTSGYKIVKHNWFVYSPSRIDVGSINFHRINENVIVSPLNVVFSIDESKIKPSFLLYYLKSHKGMFQILSKRTGIEGTGRKLLPYDKFSEIKIPVPSIDIQDEIIKKLDIYSRLCNEVLQNEIELRQKQYEYYRDKLLTFKELVNEG